MMMALMIIQFLLTAIYTTRYNKKKGYTMNEEYGDI